MKTSGDKYGLLAVSYTKKLVQTKQIPSKDGWENEARKVFDKDSYITKGCPRDCFLGICSEGLINGIPRGNYTSSILNKEYGVTAINILRKNDAYKDRPQQLWKEVLRIKNLDENKKHNHQMHVVCALWNAGLIISDKA